ncbi:MAG: tRNA (adenosine(37)-N6)-threonylcarbamoyltransferase complex transferase subunit TsaD [Candidatus Zambryskibacteria bacterium]|nr:tRNA (adenosine(37)-N6)-threonylcarbamoyltransferase complex transferase subunit TsaD [Candidatus Zambryskibacteria bacterium]
MKILSIETSCDETAVSILEIDGDLAKPKIKVLGNTLLSQAVLHEQYGGVYPNLAKREHQKNLPILLEQTLKQAHLEVGLPSVDFIAVTAGPGLEPALWVGITFAEELGRKWNKPVVPVNHMEGHVFSVLYNADKPLELPALALLISGGHTELVHIRDFGDYEIIGRTLDDAVGEAFDKVARMLGLSYPGGPIISKLAQEARTEKLESDLKFPRPMINSGNLNFSFSGLKTAVLYKLRDEKREDDEFKRMVAREFEDAVTDVLVEKTRRALSSLDTPIKTLIIAGGVSANTFISLAFAKLASEFPTLTLRLPTRELTTDNAIMIGIAAYVRVKSEPKILNDNSALIAKGNLSINSEYNRTTSLSEDIKDN